LQQLHGIYLQTKTKIVKVVYKSCKIQKTLQFYLLYAGVWCGTTAQLVVLWML